MYMNEYKRWLEANLEDAALTAEDEENSLTYNAYNYNAYYMLVSKFYEGGTKDENGTTTYSDEEQAAGIAKAEETAKTLAEAGYATVEELDKAIAALPINEGSTTAASTAYNDTFYNSINQFIREWITDSDRKAGDMTYLPNTSTTTDADGKETHIGVMVSPAPRMTPPRLWVMATPR